MMASKVHSRTHSRIANWLVPTITSQFFTTSFQTNVQAKTELNGNTLARGWSRSRSGNRVSPNANDEKSTNPQQTHGK